MLVLRGGQGPLAQGSPRSPLFIIGLLPSSESLALCVHDANRPSCFSRPYIMWVHPSTRRHTGTPTRHPEQLKRAVPGAPLAHPCHVWQTEHSHNANPTKPGQDVAFTVGLGCSRQHPKTSERIRGWILTYSMVLCLCSEPALTGGLLRTADAAHPDLNRIHTYLRDNKKMCFLY